MFSLKSYNRVKYFVFSLHFAVISISVALLQTQKIQWSRCCSQCSVDSYNTTDRESESLNRESYKIHYKTP